MLIITGHQGNANQNHKISSHTCQNGYYEKKTKDNKRWQGYRETGTLEHCWWEYKMVQSLWKILWKFLKKLKIEPLYDLAIPLLGIYPKELKLGSQRGIRTPIFIATLLTIAEVEIT